MEPAVLRVFRAVALLLLLTSACSNGQQPDRTRAIPEGLEASPTVTETGNEGPTRGAEEPSTTVSETTAPAEVDTPTTRPSETPEAATPETPTAEAANPTAQTEEAQATATPQQGTETATAAPANPAASGGATEAAIVVDHTSVADFERIPEEYIAAAQALRMIFIDQSVGSNINDGLTCLSNASSAEAPNHCVRAEHVDPKFSVDPSEVSWSRTGGYDRRNWEFQPYSSDCDGRSWAEIVPCFIQMVEPTLSSYDVLSFQFTYLHVAESSLIADQQAGYFVDSAGVMDVYDQEAFEAQHPDKVFIYWTTSLSRGIGTQASEQFNEQMREYAITNGKPLFDVADILSHDPQGNPCYDNRDGVSYDNGNNFEDYPDDGENYHAICQHYTTETDGGHLGRVSAGKIRVAKAFWVLMARIAGWDGS